jgi:hypothetical protein
MSSHEALPISKVQLHFSECPLAGIKRQSAKTFHWAPLRSKGGDLAAAAAVLDNAADNLFSFDPFHPPHARVHVVWIEFDYGHIFGPNYPVSKQVAEARNGSLEGPIFGGLLPIRQLTESFSTRRTCQPSLDPFSPIRKSDLAANAQQFRVLLIYAAVETDGSAAIGQNLWSEFRRSGERAEHGTAQFGSSGRCKAEIIQERPL